MLYVRQKSTITCATYIIKNNNVITLFTHVLIVLKKNTQMSQLFLFECYVPKQKFKTANTAIT